ncbi:hypothetical protein BRW62_06985 [Parathermosynechococcus lividus PCC 6715]|uniref:Uncharacterized protein n=1 Tax=Parathermosynechococcus lividus PCC 6715 TaxID=1917166 RepID=A0A2D2Q204_PARLV|nr:hypothetical protein BRW62_06985 [Thermostichus lividus PCC 6715]
MAGIVELLAAGASGEGGQSFVLVKGGKVMAKGMLGQRLQEIEVNYLGFAHTEPRAQGINHP